MITDVLGLVIVVYVTAASMQDREAADEAVKRAKAKVPGLKKLYVDAGYEGPCMKRLATLFNLEVELVKRSDTAGHGVWQGPQLPPFKPVPVFKVVPKRWVIERTNGWTMRYRRLVRDQDQRIDVAEAWIWLAQGTLVMRRLAAA